MVDSKSGGSYHHTLILSADALEISPEPHFLWITEFPLFTHADEDKEFLAKGRWSSTHHPFTAPMWEDMENLKAGKEDMVIIPLHPITSLRLMHTTSNQVRGQHYDLVLNGMEIGGGSVRIHDATLQEYVLKEVLEVSQYTVISEASFNNIYLISSKNPRSSASITFSRH